MIPPEFTHEYWPHAPVHKLDTDGVFMVTGATLYKTHHFRSPDRLTLLETELLKLAKEFHWALEAWAVFSNHYHFVARAEADARDLGEMLSKLHTTTATEINRLDDKAGRQVWHNFWDKKLTFQHSYLARLNYVHQNPVKHGLVTFANQYRWCSAFWFEKTATPAMVKTIYSFKIDKVKVYDEF
ncbi:MAG: transposase [Blastocatellia bacterium]